MPLYFFINLRDMITYYSQKRICRRYMLNLKFIVFLQSVPAYLTSRQHNLEHMP